MRRSAQKFQIQIVADKPWTFQPGARRTDTGHFAVEDEVARFTQGISYDVLVVADEADNFGDDLLYHTTDPPPCRRHPGHGAPAPGRGRSSNGARPSCRSRFLRQARRWATDRDYGAWMAVRAIGEAATRTNSNDPEGIIAFLHGKDFELAASRDRGSPFGHGMASCASRSCWPTTVRWSRFRRSRASCTSSPNSTRWASINRRRNAT